MKFKRYKPKVVYSWMNPKLEIRDTEKCGKGVFAKKVIDKGEVVCISGGYAMPLKEYFKLSPDVLDYLYQINEEFVFGPRNLFEVDDGYRFNHSCDPNVGYNGQIIMIAMRKIKSGEELTYDYAMELFPSKTKSPLGVDRHDKLFCNCGSKKCRKIITEYDWKNPKLIKKYDGYFIDFLQRKVDKLKNNIRKKENRERSKPSPI